MESEITEQDSVLLTKNLLRIAIFNICYIRDLFPEKFFVDQPLPALDMTVKKLKPMDAESRRLIDWVEKGVYHALEKKYLKTLLFCICEAVDGPMIEEYTFSFSYSNTNSEEVSMNINDEVSMNINRSGKKKHNSTTGMITLSQMRSPACKMLCRLFQLKSTLEKMPEERTVLMKLLYDDDVTPMDYEPPFFRGCTEKPLNKEVGEVNSKHLVLALKVKSRLDPCEDDQYIAAPREKQQLPEENGAVDEDNTQDPAEDEQQLGRVKDWIRLISSIRIGKFEFNDVLSYFPDISVVLIEEIMDKLVKESIISKAEGDSYTINKKKKFDYEFDAVKEEADGQTLVVANNGKTGNMGADPMYMKALYHTLPLEYITVPKLQNKLQGEASPTTVRKLIDKMAQDGFVEPGSSRRLGKRVVHSDLTKKKLIEVKKLLTPDAMELDNKEMGNKSNCPEPETAGNKHKDLSTCGGLHSIGSDVTRYLNGSIRSEQGVARKRELCGNNTPTSKADQRPETSRESGVPGADNGRVNVNSFHGDEMDIVTESRSSQDKRFRKASTVKEPIQQFAKRQKSQAV